MSAYGAASFSRWVSVAPIRRSRGCPSPARRTPPLALERSTHLWAAGESLALLGGDARPHIHEEPQGGSYQ
eukprot:7034071-Alexandrium_andersonii.AAC.1